MAKLYLSSSGIALPNNEKGKGRVICCAGLQLMCIFQYVALVYSNCRVLLICNYMLFCLRLPFIADSVVDSILKKKSLIVNCLTLVVV